jgi:hypothetical protein
MVWTEKNTARNQRTGVHVCLRKIGNGEVVCWGKINSVAEESRLYEARNELVSADAGILSTGVERDGEFLKIKGLVWI